ncbi:universal stress protein [Sphingosinicella soli]|uniref:Nucleotide-binding universal stress UspA family protein n=1 Tax=Sphingosinicella soli TaxID=333708 RepID=A0A7W7B1W4_9SPHN|nr:universal stress protein [Sphingosinicella soli]MBB4632354.1 nucleotide-binding universal stress UspA family protein [Sphingosinicella soli]
MKSILVHIHDDAGQAARLQAALDVARFYSGHLTCLQAMPFAAYAGEPFTGAMIAYEAYAETMEATRTRIEAQLQNEGVSWDWIDSRGSGSAAVMMHSPLTDLIVLSPPGKLTDPDAALPIVGEIATKVRAPVLVVRDDRIGFDPSATALIAWNGSPEAAQAVRNAMSMLTAAKSAHIACIEEDSASHIPAREAASYLSRHGIKAEVHARAKSGSVADTLGSIAAEVRAGYMVMGAYGRSRFAEFILGGVTRSLLTEAPLPLVLSH